METRQKLFTVCDAVKSHTLVFIRWKERLDRDLVAKKNNIISFIQNKAPDAQLRISNFEQYFYVRYNQQSEYFRNTYQKY